MTELEQAIAALIHFEAKGRTGKKFEGPVQQLWGIVEKNSNGASNRASFEIALKFWERSGCATIHRYDGMEDYVSVKPDDIVDSIYSPKMQSVFSKEKRPQYPILTSYYDLGGPWLWEYLRSRARRPAAEKDRSQESVDSSAWTGRPPQDFVLSEERRIALVRELDRAESSLSGLALSQEVRSEARAYIVAARALAESPEPPSDLIWELIHRADSLAGITSLFVSIIALFASAAH